MSSLKKWETGQKYSQDRPEANASAGVSVEHHSVGDKDFLVTSQPHRQAGQSRIVGMRSGINVGRH